MPFFPWRDGTDSVGLRPGIQSGREDVCPDAAGTGAGVSIVQSITGKFCRTYGAAQHYSRALPGAGAMGRAANQGRFAGGGTRAVAARFLRHGIREASEENTPGGFQFETFGAQGSKQKASEKETRPYPLSSATDILPC